MYGADFDESFCAERSSVLLCCNMSNAIRLLEIYFSLFWYEFPMLGQRSLLFLVFYE